MNEIIQNASNDQNVKIQYISAQYFQQTIDEEFISLIKEKCQINLDLNGKTLTLPEFEKIVNAVGDYTQVLSKSNLNDEFKTIIIKSIILKLFGYWRLSRYSELFFIKIQKKLLPHKL